MMTRDIIMQTEWPLTLTYSLLVLSSFWYWMDVSGVPRLSKSPSMSLPSHPEICSALHQWQLQHSNQSVCAQVIHWLLSPPSPSLKVYNMNVCQCIHYQPYWCSIGQCFPCISHYPNVSSSCAIWGIWPVAMEVCSWPWNSFIFAVRATILPIKLFGVEYNCLCRQVQGTH